jgi:hypothetical protein
LNTWSNPLSSSDPMGAELLASTSSNSTNSNTGTNANVNVNAATANNPNNAAPSSSFPDGVRLKLYLSPNSAWSVGSANASDTAPQAALTLDWIRPNFSGLR